MIAIIEILIIILGSIIVTLLRARYGDKVIDEPKDESSSDEQKKSTVEIYCEIIDGVYYAWLKPDNEFIGQSETLNDFAIMLVAKYPKERYHMIIEEKVA